ncbi:hypothetical protein GCM10023215_66540 [Pseudonocardia yuanmonensis]|uniref:Uncharacterized protein n=1 Tax=Pseudonocardia yuanmonensis TaxID=1095914 RepID=A0ABP8XU45_9PSEU
MSRLVTIRPGRVPAHAAEHRHTWAVASHHATSDGVVSYRRCASCGAWGLFVPDES